MIPDFHERMKELQAQNIAEGKCPDCGGAGVVADMGKIARTHNPYANRRCRTCHGTGKPKVEEFLPDALIQPIADHLVDRLTEKKDIDMRNLREDPS